LRVSVHHHNQPPENDKTWKQYSNRNIFGFFPVIYGRFLPEGTGS
jgi:hypothetical protein